MDLDDSHRFKPPADAVGGGGGGGGFLRVEHAIHARPCRSSPGFPHATLHALQYEPPHNTHTDRHSPSPAHSRALHNPHGLTPPCTPHPVHVPGSRVGGEGAPAGAVEADAAAPLLRRARARSCGEEGRSRGGRGSGGEQSRCRVGAYREDMDGT